MIAPSLPLLITATLDAGNTPMVALRDTCERTVSHLAGLICWLNDPCFKRVVFAKNCGTRIQEKILMDVAATRGKELEFVQTESSSQTMVQGKGYGEGDLVRQALGKSEILRSSDGFFKITGKLYAPESASVFNGEGAGEFYLSACHAIVRSHGLRRMIAPLYRNAEAGNFLALLKRRGRFPWGLIAASPSGWIDTRFYRVQRSFYQNVLLTSHRRVQDALGYTLENAFYDDLETQPVRTIKRQPVIVGTSGTLGTTAGEYADEILQEARELGKRLLE